jgi:hypothetical protein
MRLEDAVVAADDFFVLRTVLMHLIMEEDCIGSVNDDKTAMRVRATASD